MKLFILSVTILLLTTGTVLSQQQAGDMELQFFGSYYRTVGNDFTFASGTIGGKIGPYLTDNIQVGLGPTFSISTSSRQTFTVDPVTFQVITKTESQTTTTFGTSAFFIYSFLTRGGKLVPYFGAQYFKRDFNKPFSEDRGSAGINGGVKYFFTKKTALDFSGNYLWDLNPDAKGALILFAFGLSFLF